MRLGDSVVGCALALALSGATGCVSLPGTDATGGGSAGAFDGTYDYSYQLNANGSEQNFPDAAQLVVTNGVVTSNPAGFTGQVTDSFGDVSWQGPCPVGNTGGATFTGILDQGNPKFGQGTWVCNNGGATDAWQVSNGQ